MPPPAEPPVLWHLKVSNYNEKARWALDHKRIPHIRKAVAPGAHSRVARRLTGGTTFPVLEIDGRAIGDSTRIIAELERRRPEPALYPLDAGERRRALELEEFFDEGLGPYARLLVLHRLMADPPLLQRTFAPDLPLRRRLLGRLLFGRVRARIVADFGIDGPGVEQAYAKLRAAGERFRRELRPSGYLGERFGVADLTLAALIAPLVCPEQFPYPQPQRGHRLLEPVRDALAESGLVEWTCGVYALHRGSSAAVAEL